MLTQTHFQQQYLQTAPYQSIPMPTKTANGSYETRDYISNSINASSLTNDSYHYRPMPQQSLQMPPLPQKNTMLPQPKLQQALLPPRPLCYDSKMPLHLKPKGRNGNKYRGSLGSYDR